MEIKLMPLALTFIVGLTITSCGSKEETISGNTALKVSVKEIALQNQTLDLKYSGNIEPDNTAQIGFAVPGVVNNILVQEGQQVQQGQLLATIDATEYSNALAIANAGLVQAEDMYTRLDGLYKKGSLPEKDYIDIKTKLAQAKANKNINQKKIGDSKLYAPMSGVISGKMIERGSTAAPGVPAFTIIKTDQVYARMSVPESEVGKLKRGMDVSVFIPTLDENFEGKITIINPLADAISKTYSVKVLLKNNAGKLLPGMIAETNIKTDKSIDAVIVPVAVIVRDADGLTYVYVANQKNKAIRKRITVGSVTGNDEVIITSGLALGDKIVVAGQTHLKDGMDIRF